jgi:hypothetical protein
MTDVNVVDPAGFVAERLEQFISLRTPIVLRAFHFLAEGYVSRFRLAQLLNNQLHKPLPSLRPTRTTMLQDSFPSSDFSENIPDVCFSSSSTFLFKLLTYSRWSTKSHARLENKNPKKKKTKTAMYQFEMPKRACPRTPQTAVPIPQAHQTRSICFFKMIYSPLLSSGIFSK